jgi:Beta/Gamma crystallin
MGYFYVEQVEQKEYIPGICFANAGDAEVVIADVVKVKSGNNAGYIITNKGRWDFEKWKGYNFRDNNYGTVTILRIVIY